MEPTTPTNDDEGAYTVIQVMVLVLFALYSITFMLTSTAPVPTIPGHQHAAYQTETLLIGYIHAYDTMHSLEDPSSPSLLQNRMYKAYTGDTQPLEEAFQHYAQDPLQNVLLRTVWIPTSPPLIPQHAIPIYQTAEPQGATVGVSYEPQPASMGPMHLIPRLDKASHAAGLDIHHIPIDSYQPYTQGIINEHGTWFNTQTIYQPTNPTANYTVQRDAHTQLTGTYHTATTLNFKEPPWIDMVDVGFGFEDEFPKEYTQVITKEDLAAERLLHEANPDNEELPSEDAYPQHAFQLDTTLHGPGTLASATSLADDHDEGDEITIPNLYELTITIPSGWTDVDVDNFDAEENKEHWNQTTIHELPGEAGYEITALRNATGTYTDDYEHDPSQTPRIILDEQETDKAPFHFHARPPPETAHDTMGFHHITATLDHATALHYETNRLTVEIPSDPGRVHRTIATHVPTNIPGTQNRTYEGAINTTLPLGATIKNGAEALTIEQITWHAPPNTFQSTPKNNEDILTTPLDYEPDHNDWEINNDRSILYWNATTTCPQLAACPIAANVTLNGTPQTPENPWHTPQAHTLYNEDDIPSYLSWHVRSDRHINGAPHDRATTKPTHAIAHEATHPHPGTTHGASLWHLPPTSTPLCNEDEKKPRNQPTSQRRGDRTYYDTGPQEDGIPSIALRTDTENPCPPPHPDHACNQHIETPCPPDPTYTTDTFPIIASNRADRHIDAIGKTTYNATKNLDPTLYNQWRNGLAESRIDAPPTTRMGEPLFSTIHLDSIFHTLQEQGVANATVTAKMIDPYNAWNEDAWVQGTLISDGKPGIEEGGDSDEPGTNDIDQPFCIPYACEDPPDEPDSPDTPDPQYAPTKLNLTVQIPQHTLPGTHLLMVEVTWQALVDGATIQQTGRIVETVDVLLPSGDRAKPSLIEALAWATDW